ncbi:MAG TPA: hypothetical protein VE400_15590, partial [Mycobacterium sp.]|nr:hypothetical protein [Mycobacterium sp.]
VDPAGIDLRRQRSEIQHHRLSFAPSPIPVSFNEIGQHSSAAGNWVRVAWQLSESVCGLGD